jgi:hypothetical protein
MLYFEFPPIQGIQVSKRCRGRVSLFISVIQNVPLDGQLRLCVGRFLAHFVVPSFNLGKGFGFGFGLSGSRVSTKTREQPQYSPTTTEIASAA